MNEFQGTSITEDVGDNVLWLTPSLEIPYWQTTIGQKIIANLNEELTT